MGSESVFIGARNETTKKRAYEELSRDEVERTGLPLCRSSVKVQ